MRDRLHTRVIIAFIAAMVNLLFLTRILNEFSKSSSYHISLIFRMLDPVFISNFLADIVLAMGS